MHRDDKQIETIATHAGRRPMDNHGVINPPVYHASTILFPTLDTFAGRYSEPDKPGQVLYGLRGTPTTFALEQAMVDLDGCYGCLVFPSGVAAVATSILAFARAGDHVLMVDSAYEPSRRFCDSVLSGLDIETTYYDPLIGGDIDSLIRPNTRVLFMESPGSLTFEVQDVPALAEAAHRRGVRVVLDNTWATPLFFRAFEHGVDVCIHAATKYIAGHADIMFGMITSTEECYPVLSRTTFAFGQCAGPDDTYMVLRGVRTLPTRLAQHQTQGLKVARWLQGRPEVARVLHPALPGCPGHEVWERDFQGASGLFGVLLNDYPHGAVAAMMNGMEIFGIGASWGGFESLIMPAYPEKLRSARPWQAQGPLFRLHIGLEHVDDLIADLEAGFERLNEYRD